MALNDVFDTGYCTFCGQVQFLTVEAGSPEEANELATQKCDCDQALDERTARMSINNARERIDQLFGVGSADLEFEPITDQHLIDLLYHLVGYIARHKVRSCSMLLSGYGVAKISLTGKGKIKVERMVTRGYALEE